MRQLSPMDTPCGSIHADGCTQAEAATVVGQPSAEKFVLLAIQLCRRKNASFGLVAVSTPRFYGIKSTSSLVVRMQLTPGLATARLTNDPDPGKVRIPPDRSPAKPRSANLPSLATTTSLRDPESVAARPDR